jgi:hypothetical protein
MKPSTGPKSRAGNQRTGLVGGIRNGQFLSKVIGSLTKQLVERDGKLPSLAAQVLISQIVRLACAPKREDCQGGATLHEIAHALAGEPPGRSRSEDRTFGDPAAARHASTAFIGASDHRFGCRGDSSMQYAVTAG